MMPEEPNEVVQTEPDDVSLRTVAIVIIVSLFIAVISVFAVDVIMRVSLPVSPAPRVSDRASRSISEIEQTLLGTTSIGAARRSAQERVLERYAWVDREDGIIRIPIGRAMELRAKGVRP